MKTYIYKRKDENLTEIEQRLDQSCETYIASKRDRGISKQLKNAITKSDLLIVSSLYTIGANKKDILRELIWLQENHIPTIFYDLPATWIFDDPAASDLVLRVLIDIYSSLSESKNFEIPVITGRKQIPYPPNWAELYDQWSRGTITAKEFIERSGLKKGTFYHLVTEYRDSITQA